MNPSRVSLLAAIALIPLAGIATRLAQLQLVSRDDYISHLLKRKRSVELTRAPRGSIFDRHGEVLAEDQRAFDCYLVLEEYEENPGPLGTLLGLAPGEFRKRTDKMYARIERQAQRRPPRERRAIYRRERRTPYLLERDIDFEAALAIETNPTLYPGAVVRESLKRCYPRGTAGAHIIGYLGRVTANEQEFRRLLDEGYFTEGFEEHIGEDGIARLYRRGAFHEELLGRAGIEQRYNDDLRGRHGLLIFEREPGTSRKTLIELLPIRRGTDLRLTLDIRLQEEVERIVAEKEQAAAVVLDPSTGAVLALGSSRGFDPNDFTPPGNAAAVRAALADNVGKPMTSRAFRYAYQLGSIFKVATAVAGFCEGTMTPGETVHCSGKFIPGSNHFKCMGTHGDIDLREALARSCNCYFYNVGRRCGLETVCAWARKMGYGSPTGLDLPREASGNLPAQGRWKNDVLSLAIGQHQLLSSPLQAAVMMAVVANGGRRVTPHLRWGSAPPPESLGIPEEVIREIGLGLRDVVQSGHGTARSAGLKRFNAAGKTGTAQTYGGKPSHAWFAGYAPHDAPRYVVVAFVEHGGGGGSVAAPLAAKIFEALEE